MRPPEANAVLVEALGSSLRRGGNALEDVPDLLKRILREEAWREFTVPRGGVVKHERFVDFVTTQPTAGLGASVDLVKRIVSGDPEAVDLLDRALQVEHGGDRRSEAVTNVSNRHIERPAGTTQAAALRRLRKDAPELHAEVLAGALSAHAAMVQAGFRRRTVSVPVDRPESVVQALRKNLSSEDLAAVARMLGE